MNRFPRFLAAASLLVLMLTVLSCGIGVVEERKAHVIAFQQYLLTHTVDSTIFQQDFFSDEMRDRYYNMKRSRHAEQMQWGLDFLTRVKARLEKGRLSVLRVDGYNGYGGVFQLYQEAPEPWAMWCSVDHDGITSFHIRMNDGRKNINLL